MPTKKTNVFGLDGKPSGETELPEIFHHAPRFDLIKRAVLALQSGGFQPQGRDPLAGKRTTAESYGVGRGMSRVPRVKGERSRRAGQAAFAPGTVTGRLAHPPKTEKVIVKKINKKEKRLAFLSAVAATAKKELVEKRGHAVEQALGIPLIVTDEIQEVRRTVDVQNALSKLGVWPDVERVFRSTNIRPGKGKLRGRKKRTAVGPLIIVAADNGISRAAANLPGVDVVKAKELNVEHLAPGAQPGRLAIWSQSAVNDLAKRVSSD